MLDISALYGGLETPGTPHRYGRKVGGVDPDRVPLPVARSAKDRRPIVVWNLTRTCNLRCVHCYSDSQARRYEGELSTAECRAVLKDLAEFGVPVVLFSGGEPLVRSDIFDLIEYGRSLGLRVVLSTNGTLIDRAVAQRLAKLEVNYVGISLDSAVPTVHDRFRGVSGAFQRTLEGLRACREAGLKLGLRLTLTAQTAGQLDELFDLIEREGIQRVCFYHLCPAGRGAEVVALTPLQTRQVIDAILEHTRRVLQAGRRREVLTVDNACDGPYLYLRMLQENHPRAQEVLQMLAWNGGARFSSGVGLANIDFQGGVHADQFSMFYSFGNVRQRPFSEIWQDERDPILAGLRNRLPLLKGRCASCRFKAICGGGLRARAWLVSGDPWQADPACYLSDEEITGPALPVSADAVTA